MVLRRTVLGTAALAAALIAVGCSNSGATPAAGAAVGTTVTPNPAAKPAPGGGPTGMTGVHVTDAGANADSRFGSAMKK